MLKPPSNIETYQQIIHKKGNPQPKAIISLQNPFGKNQNLQSISLHLRNIQSKQKDNS